MAQLVSDLKDWERLMRLREYWSGKDDREERNDDDLQYKTSMWTPPKGRDPWLDLYLEEVTREIIRGTKTSGRENLTKAEHEALHDLIRDDSIVIRPADKGSGIVIFDTKDYLSRLEEEMKDGHTYQATKSDQTSKIQREVKNLITSLHKRGLIGKHQEKYMIMQQPKPGQLQGNPKLHKKDVPLRVIVNGRGHATEKVAQIAEEHLQSHVEGQASYIRDTADFLDKLLKVPQPIKVSGQADLLLFCMDVKKLYPSIPRKEGIEACKVALNSRDNPTIPTADVIKMIEIVLDNNNFSLGQSEHYVQVDGTAIGSRLGKNYACTYMGQWEEKLLENSTLKPIIFFRFIDDIFGLWQHGREELIRFQKWANGIHPNIQVDLRMSSTELEFLDVRVQMENGYIKTDLFQKPTDSKNYLHYDSNHPRHTKKAVPFGLGVRMRRICTREEDYARHRRELKTRLLERSYPENLVEAELTKVDKLDRRRLIQTGCEKGRQAQARKKSSTMNGNQVPMVVTYSGFLPDIKNILRSKRHILSNSNRLMEVFPQDPLLSFKRGRNLRDELVHEKTRKAINGRRKGRQDCGKNCVICRRMMEGRDKIPGRQGECTFDKTIGCKTENVVYGIWCDVCCSVCYVGETGGCIYTRIQNHLSTIRSENPVVDLPVSRHFKSKGHTIENMRVVGLERVWKPNVYYRRARERRWMTLLGTGQEKGGTNKRFG